MTAMERVDTVVVGAGVVGLAAAHALAAAGQEVLVLEAGDAIGTGISSRSSEVIHAGLYYAPGSLKARLAVRGRALLYDWCAAHGVPARRCGKLVVATSPAQLPEMAAIAARAAANGVADLRLLSRAEARAREPALECVAALESPSTGIVDSHALMLSLLGAAQAHGALLVLRSPVAGGRVSDDGIVLDVAGAEPVTLHARRVVNAAGLGAQALAAALHGLAPRHVPALRYAKGHYFALAGRAPFTRLVYPIPEPGGLGVHLTLDLGGQARFGPDVQWVDRIDYTVDPARAGAFYGAIRAYWPALPDGALTPAYAGIRPKLHGPGEPAADFVIQGPAEHGVPGLVNLFGIESPGLTAALAIGEWVAGLLD
jgi:L-2-hydroxyglutarate oxidase LhgO